MEEIKVSNNIRKLRFFSDEMSQQQTGRPGGLFQADDCNPGTG